MNLWVVWCTFQHSPGALQRQVTQDMENLGLPRPELSGLWVNHPHPNVVYKKTNWMRDWVRSVGRGVDP